MLLKRNIKSHIKSVRDGLVAYNIIRKKYEKSHIESVRDGLIVYNVIEKNMGNNLILPFN